MDWADDIKIETPEQIEVSLEIAGLGSRFVAQAIDWLIKWGAFAVVALVVAIGVTLAGFSMQADTASIFMLTVLILLYYLFLLGFDIYFEVQHNGQTPGKKAANIRVIREGGGPVDFQAACIRNLLGLADFLPSFYLLGSFIILLSARGQRLGDMAAGTLVIRERAVLPPADFDPEIERLALEEFVFTTEQLQGCTPADRHILRSFFQRYHDLSAHPRGQLAFRLVQTFSDKIAYQPLTPIMDAVRAEGFLASLYRDLDNLAKHQRR